MKLQHKVISILLGVALLILHTSLVSAVPPMPSGFWGTVKVSGANVPVGLPVTAWIDGVQYAVGYTMLYLGNSVYSVSVPGDDPSTTGIIEGGVEGDTVVFKIESLAANPSGIWYGGTNANLDLSSAGYLLIVTTDHGTVQKSPDHLFYPDGELVELFAVPDPGWSFSGWTGDLVGTSNPFSFNIHQNTNIIANYETSSFWIFLPLIRR